MRFRTTLLLAGKTATGMRVPDEVVEALGAGKRPPVRVTINGYTYRNTIAVYGGEYLVGVSAEHREKAGVKAGDELDVDVELDTAPREVTVPADLSVALDADPAVRRRFDALSYTNRNAIVTQVEGAKSDETRQRRIARAVEGLREGRPG
jgi:bifunctional DNA-binding transcriptional regulator/antitoxin component of YhaV-PrlF toxin-antitoxin module